MGPEAERGRVCHCPRDGPRRPPPPYAPESPTPWRPWVLPAVDAEPTGAGRSLELESEQTLRSKGAFGFQHPVRLYLPISKRQEYLQSSGEQVLASFPVQATIHFYNDESDSEEEAGEQEEGAQDPTLQGQQAGGPQENGPGGACTAQLLSRGGRPRGQPPHQEPSGKASVPLLNKPIPCPCQAPKATCSTPISTCPLGDRTLCMLFWVHLGVGELLSPWSAVWAWHKLSFYFSFSGWLFLGAFVHTFEKGLWEKEVCANMAVTR